MFERIVNCISLFVNLGKCDAMVKKLFGKEIILSIHRTWCENVFLLFQLISVVNLTLVNYCTWVQIHWSVFIRYHKNTIWMLCDVSKGYLKDISKNIQSCWWPVFSTLRSQNLISLFVASLFFLFLFKLRSLIF